MIFINKFDLKFYDLHIISVINPFPVVRYEYPYVICTQKWLRSTKMMIKVNKNDDHGIFGMIGYRVYGANEVWSVFTVPVGLVKCVYRTWGANEVCLLSLRG